MRGRATHFRWAVLLAAVGTVSRSPAGEMGVTEPVIEENITDVDARRVGTLEMDVAGSSLAPRGTLRSGGWSSEIEAEWRPIDRWGVGAGLAISGPTSGLAPVSAKELTPRISASYLVVRDRPRRLFLQSEVTARSARGDRAVQRDPLDPALPYTFGLRWANEIRPITLRYGLFGEAGDAVARAPFRQSFAVYLKCFEPPRVDLGAEFIADWARPHPMLVAPELLLTANVFGQPMRAGVAVPMTLGAKEDAEIGFAFRIVLEPED